MRRPDKLIEPTVEVCAFMRFSVALGAAYWAGRQPEMQWTPASGSSRMRMSKSHSRLSLEDPVSTRSISTVLPVVRELSSVSRNGSCSNSVEKSTA